MEMVAETGTVALVEMERVVAMVLGALVWVVWEGVLAMVAHLEAMWEVVLVEEVARLVGVKMGAALVEQVARVAVKAQVGFGV